MNYVERFDIPHSYVKIIPFVGESEPDINPEGKVICMGSYSMRHLAKKKNWFPGVMDIGDITYSDMVEHWGERMLNHDAIYGRFDALEPPCDPFFMRPVHDSKYFAGDIFTISQLEYWRHGVVDLGEDDGTGLRADTMVLMAKPKEIAKEFRIWVVGGMFVTASQYKLGGRVVYSDVVENWVKFMYGSNFPDMWMPEKNGTYVIDVCETIDGKHYIIECNTMNAAGLYKANVPLLINALEDYYDRD